MAPRRGAGAWLAPPCADMPVIFIYACFFIFSIYIAVFVYRMNDPAS